MMLVSALETVSAPATIARMPSSTSCWSGGAGLSGWSSLFCTVCNNASGETGSAGSRHTRPRTYEVVEEVGRDGSPLNPAHCKLLAKLQERVEGLHRGGYMGDIEPEPRHLGQYRRWTGRCQRTQVLENGGNVHYTLFENAPDVTCVAFLQQLRSSAKAAISQMSVSPNETQQMDTHVMSDIRS